MAIATGLVGVLTGCGTAQTSAPSGSTSAANSPQVSAAAPASSAVANAAKPSPGSSAAQTVSATASASAAAKPSPAASGMQKLTVNVASFSYQHLKVIVAKEAGIFAKNGLDVSPIVGPSGIAALIANDIQIATTSGEAALLADLGGADLELVAYGAPYLQQDFVVRPEIKTMADLKGKPVGISGRGTVTETVVRLAAKRGGVDADKELQLVDTGAPDKAVLAMAAGAISGAGLASPNTEAAVGQGAHVLYNFSNEQVPYPSANTIVRRDWALKNEATLLAYLRSIAEAVRLYETKTDQVAEIHAKWAKLDVPTARGAVETGIKNMPIDKTTPSAEGIKVLQGIVALQNPSATQADISRFYDDRYGKKLEADGFFKQLLASS